MTTYQRHPHGHQSTQPDAPYLVASVQLSNDFRDPLDQLQPKK